MLPTTNVLQTHTIYYMNYLLYYYTYIIYMYNWIYIHNQFF